MEIGCVIVNCPIKLLKIVKMRDFGTQKHNYIGETGETNCVPVVLGGGIITNCIIRFFSIFILFIMDSPKQFAPDYKEGNWKPYGNFEVDELSDSDSEMDTIQTESEDDYEDYIKNFIDF
ncbi:hypothetical protein WA158_006992 [Blastocystis sp. Blastoise]